MYNLNILVTGTKNKQLSKPIKYFQFISLVQNTQKEMIHIDSG